MSKTTFTAELVWNDGHNDIVLASGKLDIDKKRG